MKLVDIITGILAILALVSVGLGAWSLVNYQEGMEAIQSFQLDLTEVQLTADDDEIQTTFRLSNNVPLDLVLSYFHFSLYLNGNFMGSNYTPLTDQALAGSAEEVVTFVIPLRPFYEQYIAEARAGEGFAWSIRGFVRLYLPRYEHEVTLNVREQWRENDE
jgi:LEA14-like dessication related protein